jgi:hypothetical protein
MHVAFPARHLAIFAYHQTSNHFSSYLPVSILHPSTEESCVISISLNENEEGREVEVVNRQNSEKCKRKRFSFHKMVNKRKTEGEYWILSQELMDHEEMFFRYFGFSQHELWVWGKISKL